MSHAELLAARRTVTSQWGEDGILAEIFRRIGTRNRVCVELGAGNGKDLSNTWDLWRNQGWKAVLLEGDAERAAALRAETAGHPQAHAVHAFVEVEGERSLEALLAPFDVPNDVDLLSVDIDGDDYHLFAGLKRLRPRVLLVEFNPTIPPEIDVVQPRGARFGASAKALLNLAHERGLRLATVTDTNLVLVREADFPALGIEEPPLERVFPQSALTYVVSSFDGATFLTRTPVYVYRVPPRRALELRVREKPHPDLPPGAGLLPVVIRRTGPPIP